MDRSKSAELYARAIEMIPGGVNSPVRASKQVGGKPVYFKSARGSRFTDADGNEYVDYCMSWGPLILGHTRPEVVEAVRSAAGDGLSYGACHAREVELAELVLQAFPGFDKIRTVSSGTEAVMTALRIARGATGRESVVKFDGGYHGHFDGMLVKAGSGLATHAIASSSGIPAGIAATTFVLPFDDEQALRELFQQRGDEIAAVIIEPLPANNGLLVQRPEFLATLREVTRAHGALLIFDEVISGFRLRYGGYGSTVDVDPDIVTLGKIIGGGMPVGAVVGPARLMDVLSPLGSVYQAGTLSGNPVSLAAGVATLKLLRDDPPYDRLETLGRFFVDSLGASVKTQRVGSIVWLYLDDADLPVSADAISQRAMDRFVGIYGRLLDAGHYLPPSSYEVMFLSAAHTQEEVGRLAAAVVQNLEAAE